MLKVTWQQIPSPLVTEIICHSDSLDGVVFDTEHGMYNPETLFSCIQVARLKGKEAYVRFPNCDTGAVRHALDAGATGLIFAMVDSAEYCLDIRGTCLYPSQGGNRGLGLVRSNMWGETKLMADPPKMIVQIENMEGVKKIELLHHMCFDYYMIGPYDLSSDLGIPGQFTNPAYKNAVKKVMDTVGIENMGCHLVRAEQIKAEIDDVRDYGFVAISMDTIMIAECLSDMDGLL